MIWVRIVSVSFSEIFHSILLSGMYHVVSLVIMNFGLKFQVNTYNTPRHLPHKSNGKVVVNKYGSLGKSNAVARVLRFRDFTLVLTAAET